MARLIFLIFLFAALAHAGCFRPNGTTRNDPTGPDAYVSCSSSSTHSMCCRNGNGLGSDVCRDDGLCSNGDAIWRESCTDSTWKSEACIKLCISDSLFFQGDPYNGTDVPITECDNGSLCCGNNSIGKSCCQQGKGVWLVSGKVLSVNPSSTSSLVPATTSTSASKVTTTGSTSTLVSYSTTGSTNQPSNQGSTSRDYTGVIAGCAVGGIIFLAVLVCLLWWLTFKKKKSYPKSAGAVELDSSMNYQAGNVAYKYEQQQHISPVYHEAPTDPSVELPTMKRDR